MRFIYHITSRANAISFSFLLAFPAIFARRECNFSLFPQDSFNIHHFRTICHATSSARALKRKTRVIDEKYQKARHDIATLVLRNIEIESTTRAITKVSRYSWRSSISICIDRAITGLLLQYFARYASASRVLSRRNNGEKRPSYIKYLFE